MGRIKLGYAGGCQHDDCDTCPYPDCIATAYQINNDKCGSKTIPTQTDIRLPREYKPQADPPKVKAVIKTSMAKTVPDGGKAMDAEELKRKKHEWYLKSKEKKAAEKAALAATEKKDPVKVKEPDPAERENNKMQLDIDKAIEMMRDMNADDVEYKLFKEIDGQAYIIKIRIEAP